MRFKATPSPQKSLSVVGGRPIHPPEKLRLDSERKKRGTRSVTMKYTEPITAASPSPPSCASRLIIHALWSTHLKFQIYVYPAHKCSHSVAACLAAHALPCTSFRFFAATPNPRLHFAHLSAYLRPSLRSRHTFILEMSPVGADN